MSMTGRLIVAVKFLDKYAAQDNRIKVINQSNGGLSAARNHGLRLRPVTMCCLLILMIGLVRIVLKNWLVPLRKAMQMWPVCMIFCLTIRRKNC